MGFASLYPSYGLFPRKIMLLLFRHGPPRTRIVGPGLPHHVTQRGNRGQKIFCGQCPSKAVSQSETFLLTLVPISVTSDKSCSSRDAFGRGYSRKRSECGARARKDTLRSRAALGIMSAGTTAGAWGASTGLGQARAGNARRTRVPGSLAWS